MEKINELLAKIEEQCKADAASSEERVKELAEIDEHIKQISAVLSVLFDRREELMTQEEDHQMKQQAIEEDYNGLKDFFAAKK